MSLVMDRAVSAQRSKLELPNSGRKITRDEAIELWNRRDTNVKTKTTLGGWVMFVTVNGTYVKANKITKQYAIINKSDFR